MKRSAQLARYSGTAGIAACVDIGLFGLFYAAGVPLVVAAALSFLVATVVNYVLTAHHVFKTRINLSGYIRFLAAASLGFALNVGTTTIVGHVFGLHALLAKIIGVGVAFFANFAMNVTFVFRSAKGSNQSSDQSKL